MNTTGFDGSPSALLQELGEYDNEGLMGLHEMAKQGKSDWDTLLNAIRDQLRHNMLDRGSRAISGQHYKAELKDPSIDISIMKELKDQAMSLGIAEEVTNAHTPEHQHDGCAVCGSKDVTVVEKWDRRKLMPMTNGKFGPEAETIIKKSELWVNSKIEVKEVKR